MSHVMAKAAGCVDDVGRPYQWFFRDADRKAANAALKAVGGAGAFLIRFSGSEPRQLVLSYTSADKVKNNLINNVGAEGWSITVSKKEHKFASVSDLLNVQISSGRLKQSATSPLYLKHGPPAAPSGGAYASVRRACLFACAARVFALMHVPCSLTRPRRWPVALEGRWGHQVHREAPTPV